MTEIQTTQIINLLEQQVYYQGALLYAVVVTVGIAITVGVCILLYRAIKIFY